MRTYELNLVASVDEIVSTIDVLKDEHTGIKHIKPFADKMLTSLHDLVCSGERFSREDLLKIKALAKSYNRELMIMDCDSRIRNIVGN